MKGQLTNTFCFLIAVFSAFMAVGQTSNNPAPYCNGNYSNGNCLQGGPPNTNGNGVNDFIDSFNTIGGNTNISNDSSFCNGGPNNYVNYCQHYLGVTAGQTITCNVRSGIIYAQGFSIWVDWNQDNIFSNPAEQVAATSNVPAAHSWTTLVFVVPPATPPGLYRMRVRCAFSTNGTNITPCGTFAFGETEDYTIYVGGVTPVTSVVTITAVVSPSIICVGANLNFGATSSYSGVLNYAWTGPNNYSSTVNSPVITNASALATGIYTVVGTNVSCPASTTVEALVVAYPDVTVTPSPFTVCQGGNFNVSVIVNGNSSDYNYLWQSVGTSTIFTPSNQSTLIFPYLLPVNVPQANINYSITVTPTILSCPTSSFMTLTVLNPLTPTLNMPPPICNINNPLQLTASPSGGIWGGNPAVTASGMFTPSLATINWNYVSYTVAAGNCFVTHTDSVEVSRFHTAALTSGVPTRCVQDPLFNLMTIVQDTATGSWSGTNVNNNLFNPANLPSGNYVLTYNSPSYPNLTVCPSSTTFVMPVFNPPTPTISNIIPVCNTAGTIQLTAFPAGGVWSGSSGVSVAGVRSPSSCLIGTNSVIYTAGQNTCVSASSKTFHVTQFISANITGTINPMCVSSPPFNLMSIVQNTSGSWSGPGVFVTNVFSPLGLSSNNYSLTYFSPSSPNQTLCPDSRNLVVSVLNPATPTITTVGPFCVKDAAIQLTVSPAIGAWVITPHLTANGVFIPSLSAIGNNPIQYVIGTNTCNVQQTIQINIEDFVPATVLLAMPHLCNTSPVLNLNPYTANSLGTWSGPGVSGNNFNPATPGAGDFMLFYATASQPSGLCPDRDSMAVKIFSLEIPTVAQAGPYCNNALPLQLVVSPLGGLFGGGINGAISIQGVFNPGLALIGKNVVSYSISAGPCIAHAQSTIEIEEFISAAIVKQPAPAYCKNETPFNLYSFVKNTGGTWNGPGVTPTYMFDPFKANIGNNNVLFYHTQSFPNGLLCPDVSTIQIKVKDQPTPPVSTTSLTGCAPLKVAFSSTESPMGLGTWNMGDGSAELNGFKITHVYSRTGTFDIIYNYQDLEAPGCSSLVKLPNPVIVLPQPKADFWVYPEEVTISDPRVTLVNGSSDLYGNQYMWTIYGMQQYFELNPVVEFPQANTYRVILQATNLAGCKSEITKFIEVKNDFNVFIPNAFTPNFDGLNDVFKPVFSLYGLDPATYQMNIYDRWGQIIFNTKDPNKGWDGSVGNKGDSSVKGDTYNYQITFKDLEGKIYKKEGTVTVMP